MDLFSLVASLTLDTTDYEQKINDAPDAAKDASGGSKLDVSGTAELDTTAYNTAAGNAETRAEEMETNIGQTMEKLKNAIVAAGVVKAIAKIGRAMWGAVTDTAEYASSVRDGAEALSMSTRTYQEWNYVLGQNSASMHNVQRGWNNLVDVMNGKAADDVSEALAAIGVDPSQYKSVDELFEAVIYGLAAMDEGAERDDLTKALFGNADWKTLNVLLNTSVEEIAELRKEAQELGIIMSDEDIKNGVAFGDSLTAMNEAIDGIKRDIVSGLFPVLTDAMNMVSSIIKWLRGEGDNGIEKWFSDIDEDMRKAFATANRDEAKANSLIGTLKSMSDETGHCKDNLDKWRGIAQELIDICPELRDQIDLVTGSYNEQNGTLEENTRLFFANARKEAIYNAVKKKGEVIEQKTAELIDMQIDLQVKQSELDSKTLNMRRAFLKVWDYRKAHGLDLDGISREDIEGAKDMSALTKLWDKAVSYKYKPDYSKEAQSWVEEVIANSDYISYTGSVQYQIRELEDRIAKAQKELADAEVEYAKFASASKDMAELTDVTGTYAISLPEGDTLNEWRNFFKLIELGAGRTLSFDERQALIERFRSEGRDVNDSLNIPEGEFDISEARIDGNYVIVNGVSWGLGEDNYGFGWGGKDDMFGVTLPQGDTGQEWENFFKVVEFAAGRALSMEEKQHYIEVAKSKNWSVPDRFGWDKATIDTSTATVEGNTVIINGAKIDLGATNLGFGWSDKFEGHAKGAWEIPYNDYAAYLHRGEMVLTASQARRYREGSTNDSAVVDAILGLRNDIQHLQLVVGQKQFGRTVVEYGGKRMDGYIGSAEDRVAAGYGWG